MALGHGKVILLGEHAVVHGRPALAVALDRGARALARAAQRDTLAIEPWSVEVAPDAGSDEPLARAFAAALALYDARARTPLRVEARVQLPAGAGLGCSAALGVAVLGALDEALAVERTAQERAEASLVWERVFHGNPSGVDGAMAARGGVAVFQRGEPLEHVRLRAPLRLVIGDTGAPSSTKAMVEAVARQRARAPERLEQVFDSMAVLVRNGRLAVQDGRLRDLGQLMDLGQNLLASLLVSTTRLEELCAAARGAGALGAKLTGAGGGGCMIALAASEEAALALREVLAAEGAAAFVAEVGP